MGKFLRALAADIFWLMISTYLVLFLLESVKKGFVSHLINLDYLLAATVISGLSTVIMGKEGKAIRVSKWSLINNPIYLSWTIGIVIFYALRQLGIPALLISVLSATVLFLYFSSFKK